MSVTSAVAAVERQGGLARTAELIDVGIRKRDLAYAVGTGLLLRPRRGVYALPSTATPVLEAVSHCGVLACVSASRDYGLWTLDLGAEEQVHTWVDPDHRPVRVAIEPGAEESSCCVFHRDTALDAPELRRVGIVHCLIQILRCRGVEVFFAALESALRQGLLDAGQKRRLRASVALEHRWLIDFARSDADSGLESLLRLRLHRRGITLASQVHVPGVGNVDFVIGDCLILEADGATHEGDSRHTDRIRDAVAMTLGFVTLRFDSAMILHEWDLVEAAVLAALARDLHRSNAGRTW